MFKFRGDAENHKTRPGTPGRGTTRRCSRTETATRRPIHACGSADNGNPARKLALKRIIWVQQDVAVETT
ncbi:MAG: hypothetical protein J6I72_01340 [Muribaculaceae bacterium]|nr:hypothetical protein [Muribaculaceae bacterium]